MKASRGLSRWLPLVSVAAVGVLALSLSLEGAPSVKEGRRRGETARGGVTPAGTATSTKSAVLQTQAGAASKGQAGQSGSAGLRIPNSGVMRIKGKDVPIAPTVTVNWQDDEPSKLRREGKLVGPWRPDVGAVAAGACPGNACSFDIDCDDCDPCTDDRCVIDVAAGDGLCDGACQNTPAPNGQGQTECSDGVFCNGIESCQGASIHLCRGVCSGGPNNGQSCANKIACSGSPCISMVCQTGPNAAQACVDDADCSVEGDCEAPGAGTGVPTDQDFKVPCDGICDSGLRAARRCDCPGGTCNPTTCLGGGNNGQACPGGQAQCPGGTCQGSCGGGAQNGSACNIGNNCPTNGACLAAVCTEDDGCTPDCRERRCSAASSNAGGKCSVNGDCPGGVCNTPDQVCDDGLFCTGTDTCDLTDGICDQTGDTCGFLATCLETSCQPNLPGTPAANWGCFTNTDCPNQTAGSCTDRNEAGCLRGRCCTGVNNLTCGVASAVSCADPGEMWFATVDGGVASGSAGVSCAVTEPDIQCPRYTAGVVVNAGTEPNLNVVLGPASTATCEGLTEIGDDYTIAGADQYVDVNALIWVGGVETVAEERVLIEFRDAAGAFIEDAFFVSGSGLAYRPVQFDPPITLPASGFVVFSVATAFAPNGRVFVATTDAPQVGTNNATRVWRNGGIDNSNSVGICNGGTRDGLNCDPGGSPTCPGGACDDVDDTLAFELAGGPAAATPEGACCASGGACSLQLSWVCKNTVGSTFVAEGQLCNQCSANSPAAGDECVTVADCRLCTSGAEFGQACTVAADCTGNGSSFCVGGGNNGLGCTVPANCPGGVCIAVACQGTCDPACASGACCTAGACTITTGACPGGTFQGFGTDCDPNCCTVPGNSGRDDCEDADNPGVILDITVPIGNQPDVYTLSGDNSVASLPDSCTASDFNPAENNPDDVDRGWWHAIKINDCAFVRFDMCCTDPIHAPQYRYLYTGCPCETQTSDFVLSSFNPNNDDTRGVDDSGQARGAPFCPDDNLWWQYGPLAGTNDADQDYYCSGGSNAGQFCCPSGTCGPTTCQGGSNNGNPCTTDANCPGGLCRFACTGGPHNGQPCTVSTCPGGECLPTKGIYYQPIFSALAGHNGPYQLHVTVEACPDAACCYQTCTGGTTPGAFCNRNSDCGGGGSCDSQCQLLNILECEDRGGYYQGPPNRETANTICGTSCNTGSCCPAPGVCVDDQNPGSAVDPTDNADCDIAGGIFVGGVRCAGGTCSAGDNAGGSCNDNTDCPPAGNLCNGSTEQLAQPNPCPVCEILDPLNCQIGAGFGFTGARLSDDCVGDCTLDSSNGGIRVADDFVANATGNITIVCVRGEYLLQGGGLADCYASANPNKEFTVKVYNDNSGTPGTLVVATTTDIIGEGVQYAEPDTPPTNHVVNQLSLNTPIPVVNGNRYWLEVVNDTIGSPPHNGNCDWFWDFAQAGEGNQWSYQNQYPTDSPQSYVADDALTVDLHWCLNIENEAPGTPERACCVCEDNTCAVRTFNACVNQLRGAWYFDEPECLGFSCSIAGGPSNDSCPSAQAVNEVNLDWESFCADSSPPPLDLVDCGATQLTNFDKDIWYKYTATCTGLATISLCNPAREIDSVLAIYSDNTNVCPCPTSAGNQIGECNDDGCVFAGGGSEIALNVVANNCYTIRVGGFEDDQGRGSLEITCIEVEDNPKPNPGNDTCVGGSTPGAPCADNADCPGGGQCLTKNRFVSFSVPAPSSAAAAATSIQVKVIDVPANLPTLAATLENDVWWAGVPTSRPEGPPGGNFMAAQLECTNTPITRDWSADGVVHLYGPAVVPGTRYEVRNCSTPSTCSAPLVVTTARYGDVVTPVGAGQPNFIDISALVDKFQGDAGSVSKTRAQMQPNTLNTSANIGFLDISEVVNAFKGLLYGFTGQNCTP